MLTCLTCRRQYSTRRRQSCAGMHLRHGRAVSVLNQPFLNKHTLVIGRSSRLHEVLQALVVAWDRHGSTGVSLWCNLVFFLSTSAIWEPAVLAL